MEFCHSRIQSQVLNGACWPRAAEATRLEKFSRMVRNGKALWRLGRKTLFSSHISSTTRVLKRAPPLFDHESIRVALER